jgi:Ser/Thr protein kinase RdoA (MazF antagonist)
MFLINARFYTFILQSSRQKAYICASFDNFCLQMEKLAAIVSQFEIHGTVESIAPFGAGLINDTYRVTTSEAGADDYVLQRVNHAIFRDVALLQSNIRRVTDHIRARLAARGEDDIHRKALRLVSARDGKLFYHDGESYWRVTVLIPRAVSHEQVTSGSAYSTGRAFGDFQGMLADLPAENGEPLGATIPDFHNMEFRLEQLRDAIRDDKAGRVEEMRPVIDDILSRAEEMCLPQRLAREGRLPRRTSHCDTKVNNVLFDEDSGEVLCVIDLDTTMPGFVMSDFGDFIRTAANTGAEDDENLDRVGLDMEIFKAFARGYLETAGGFLTPTEVDMLPFGARLLTYMQAVRFLTDYLGGDTYYKISSPHHNRTRTMAQLAMLRSIEKNYELMKTYIKSL